MKKILGLIILVLLLMDSIPKVLAETYILARDVLACSTIETYVEAMAYVQKNDRGAFKQMFGIFGPCEMLKAGTKFDVYDRVTKKGSYSQNNPITFMLVRPYGKRDKLWILEQAADIQ